MSGHSKWSQIRHKKAIVDRKKGESFSKISKLITIAARRGTDPRTNSSLAGIVDRARSLNMPKDNIERAIKKVSEKADDIEELIIDALGKDGLAVRIKAVTDSRNRTMGELRNVLDEFDFKITPPRSLDWIFNNTQDKIVGSENEKILELLEALKEHTDVTEVEKNFKE